MTPEREQEIRKVAALATSYPGDPFHAAESIRDLLAALDAERVRCAALERERDRLLSPQPTSSLDGLAERAKEVGLDWVAKSIEMFHWSTWAVYAGHGEQARRAAVWKEERAELERERDEAVARARRAEWAWDEWRADANHLERERDEWKARAEQFRIEADCRLRDFDAQEFDLGLTRERAAVVVRALSQIRQDGNVRRIWATVDAAFAAGRPGSGAPAECPHCHVALVDGTCVAGCYYRAPVSGVGAEQ